MREHGLDGAGLRPLRRRLRPRPHRLPVRRRRPARFREFVVDAAAAGRPRTAARCPASTATAGPAASCCRYMYSPDAIGAVRPRSSTLFDPANLLNPGVIVDPAPVDADLRVPAARPLRTNLALRLPARRRRPVDRRAPLRRRGQVPRRHHRGRRRDVPVLPGHPRREGLHPRPGPGAAGARQRLAGQRLRRAARSPSRSTCACPARAARPTARPASTWRPTRPRCCTSATAAGCARRRTTRWAGCRAGPGSPRGAPRLANAALRSAALAGAGQAARRHRPAPPAAAASPTQTFRRLVRARARSRTGDAGAALGRHLHRPLQPRGRAGRGARCSRRAGYAVRITDKPVCCGLTWISTGQLDGARRQLRAHPRRAGPAPRGTASRSSGSSRRAPRCCATTSPSCCPTTRARRRSRRRPARWPSCSTATPGWTRAATWPASRPSPSRTATSTRSWAGSADAALLRRRRRRRRRRSAAAAGWPATSASSAATTRCRSRSPRPRCCPPSAPRAARRGRAGRRVLLPHPARAARPARHGVHLAQLLAEHLTADATEDDR